MEQARIDWCGLNYQKIRTNAPPTSRDKISFVVRMALGAGLMRGLQRFVPSLTPRKIVTLTVLAEGIDLATNHGFKGKYEDEIGHFLGTKAVFRGMQAFCLLTLVGQGWNQLTLRQIMPGLGNLLFSAAGAGLIGLKSRWDNERRG